MRVAIVVLLSLVFVSPAAATTKAQARKAADHKLTAVYGDKWRHHTPTWSKPECGQAVAKKWTCLAEFSYQGIWYSGFVDVNRGRVKFYKAYTAQWTRSWYDERDACKDSQGVPGTLWGNRGQGCDAVTIWQNYGASKDDSGTVQFTGPKKSLFYFGTGTAIWPDFYGYKCTWANQMLQCLNRFGDGFRWSPHEDVAMGSRFYARFANGDAGCVLMPGDVMTCEAFPLNDGVGMLMMHAELHTDGTFTSCNSEFDDPECFTGGLQPGAPMFAPGDTLTSGPYQCAVDATSIRCTVNGKGMAITPVGETPIGS